MRKFLFWVSVLIAAGFLISVCSKLIFDFSRLTNFGFGYIAGQAILLLLFTFIAILLGRKVWSLKK